MAKSEQKLELNLGIDFGTSYTKVCLWGDDGGSPTVINLGEEEPNAGMFPDGVYLLPDKKKVTQHLKMQLSNLSLLELRNNKNLLDEETKKNFSEEKVREIENLSAYFLSQVIVTAKKSFENSASGKKNRLKNKTPEWSANLAVPVKYGDSPVLAYFHRVLHLALFLSEQEFNNLTYGELKSILVQPKIRYLETFALEDHLENLDLETLKNFVSKLKREEKNNVFSELEAIIHPLDNVDGAYFILDIGGGTVDGTSCFLRAKGDPDFYYTSLEEIGTKTLPVDEDMVFEPNSKKTLENIDSLSSTLPVVQRSWTPSKSGDYLCNVHKVSKEAIDKKLESNEKKDEKNLRMILHQQKIHQQVGDLVISTKNKGFTIPDFVLVGGGATSPFYKKTIMDTWKCFKQEMAGIPEYKVSVFSNPRNKNKEKGLDMNGIPEHYFNRYLIAYGLCIPRTGTAKFPDGFEIKKPNIKKLDHWDENYTWRENANIGTGRLS